MAGLHGAVSRRTIALQKLSELTGGKPFGVLKPGGDKSDSILWEAHLFEYLVDSFGPIIQRLNKLEAADPASNKKQ